MRVSSRPRFYGAWMVSVEAISCGRPQNATHFPAKSNIAQMQIVRPLPTKAAVKVIGCVAVFIREKAGMGPVAE